MVSPRTPLTPHPLSTPPHAQVGYIYVTRILVFVLYETLSFSRTWLAPASEEAATLAFYLYAGWRFRPAEENAQYLSVPNDGEGAEGAVGSEEPHVYPPKLEHSMQTQQARPRLEPKPAAVVGAAAAVSVAIADDDAADDFGLDDDTDELLTSSSGALGGATARR